MIGIMTAMTEEIGLLMANLSDVSEVVERGMRTYHRGRLWGVPVVLVFSRWGKVSAATTVTHLLCEFGVTELIFTGVAGAVDPSLRIGDVVVADCLVQHDMDARPLYGRHEIPLLNKVNFEPDNALRDELIGATHAYLDTDWESSIPEALRSRFGIRNPRYVVGRVVSGDKFFASKAAVNALRRRLAAACVEMEGAAVAQVCYEHSMKFAVVRTISDSANEVAPIAFPAFVRDVAAVYSHGIIRRFLTGRK